MYYGGSQEGQKGRSTLSTINTTKITTVRRVIGWLEERLFERASSTFNDNKTNNTIRTTTTTTISWWKGGAIVQIGWLLERAWRSLEACCCCCCWDDSTDWWVLEGWRAWRSLEASTNQTTPSCLAHPDTQHDRIMRIYYAFLQQK